MKSSKTPGHLLREIEEALLNAFPRKAELERMLRYQLDIKLAEIAGGENYTEILYNIITHFDSQNRLLELVNESQKSNPENIKLQLLLKKVLTQYPEVTNNPITKYFDNELVPIIQEIDFEICNNVSKKVLPELDLHLPNYRIGNVDDLRKLFLHKYSDRLSDGSLPIVKFADYLANDNRLQDPVREKFRVWVKTVTHELDLSYSFDSKMEKPETFNSYLLFFIKPQDTQFYINAYLIPNDKDKESIEPLDLDSGQKGILCSYNEIESKIGLLIKESQKKLVDILDKSWELTIEVFWTIDYLHEQVEHWKLTNEGDRDEFNEFYLGEKYRLVVRSYDRLERPDLIQALRKGRVRLNIFRANLNEQVIHDTIEHLKELDSCNWKELINRLEEKIGLRLTCSLPVTEKERRELFKAIVISGIPIAIWTRTSNITNVCLEDEIQKFYNVGSLKDFSTLFELLRKERKNAYAKKECEKYLGYHLGVLCEEPHLEEFRNLKEAIKNLIGVKNG